MLTDHPIILDTVNDDLKNKLQTVFDLDINTKITGVKIQLSEAESEQQLVEQRIAQLCLNVEELKQSIQEKNKEIGDGSLRQGDINLKIQAFKDQIIEKQDEIVKLTEMVEAVKLEREKNEKQFITFNEATKQLNEKLILLAQEQTRIEEKTTRQEAEFGSINSRLWEEYELTFTLPRFLIFDLSEFTYF